MIINSKHFGHIEIPEEDIIRFPYGLYGFENVKEYVLLGKVEDENPFMWLHAVHEPDVCFVVIDPYVFKKDYSPSINDKILHKLEVEDPADIRYLSIVVIPQDVSKMTANLQGPIVINAKKNIAMQVILDDEEYGTRHYILEEMKKGA
ncbi:MAG: flagellar assembly protein FliW, partial [Clostridiales bacterium]|nr:flagellar assembly protein FliW [Clostridiales bacterium]